MASTVYESVIIDAPLDHVWDKLHLLDFRFQGNVRAVQLEDKANPNTVGGFRRVTYADGTVQRIKLVELSEAGHYITWDVVESVPAVTYMSATHTIRCRRVTDSNKTFVEFTSDFSRDATPAVLADSKFKKIDFFRALASVTESRAAAFLKNLDWSNVKKLTASQVEDAWTQFDTDRNGSLDPSEVEKLVEALLPKIAEEQHAVQSCLINMFAEAGERVELPEEKLFTDAANAPPAVAHKETKAAAKANKKDDKDEKHTKHEKKAGGEAKQPPAPHHVRLGRRVVANIRKQTKGLARELLGRLDTNRDGRIDKSEFQVLFPAWFERKILDGLRGAYF